ncbi:hypothetical protein BFJ72_g12484 [Fusarium proliferatum]|uniref:Uncharacterized protein n=1 Tax=Gibberella intermedia TaxID=948311 RepID=A0A420SGK0_GIBIN|nr:hypothetical protein BFJ72_g12484 [Fusarium proliferatum]
MAPEPIPSCLQRQYDPIHIDNEDNDSDIPHNFFDGLSDGDDETTPKDHPEKPQDGEQRILEPENHVQPDKPPRGKKHMPNPDTVTTIEIWLDFESGIPKYVEGDDEIHDAMRDIVKRLLKTTLDHDMYDLQRNDWVRLQAFIALLFQEEKYGKRLKTQIREVPERPEKPKTNDKKAKDKWLRKMMTYREDILHQFEEWDDDNGEARYAKANEKPDAAKGVFPRRAPELEGAPGLSNANDYPEFKLNDLTADHLSPKDDFKCYMKAVDMWIEWAHKLNGDDRTYWLANAGNLCKTPNTKTFTNSKYAKRNQSWANLTLAKILYGTDDVLNANKILEYQAIYPKADLTKWEPNEDGPAPQHAERMKGDDPKGKGKAKVTPRKRPVVLLDDDDAETNTTPGGTSQRGAARAKRARNSIKPKTEAGPSVQRLDALDGNTFYHRTDEDTKDFYKNMLAKMDALTASNVSIAQSHNRMADAHLQLAQATKDLQQTLLANQTQANLTQMTMMNRQMQPNFQDMATPGLANRNMAYQSIANQNVGLQNALDNPFNTNANTPQQSSDYNTP